LKKNKIARTELQYLDDIGRPVTQDKAVRLVETYYDKQDNYIGASMSYNPSNSKNTLRSMQKPPT